MPSSKHILIVEDSPDLQALLGQLFVGEGFQVSRAFNGRDALDFLRSAPQQPSVILLDIMMPIMDGIEFRQAQEQDPKLSHIPVIVMTADSNSQSKAAHMHAVEHFRKPISDIALLLSTVEKYCA